MNPRSSPNCNLPSSNLSTLTPFFSSLPHPIRAQILLVLHSKYLQNLTTSYHFCHCHSGQSCHHLLPDYSRRLLTDLLALALPAPVWSHYTDESNPVGSCCSCIPLIQSKSQRLNSGPWGLWDQPPRCSSGLIYTHPRPLGFSYAGLLTVSGTPGTHLCPRAFLYLSFPLPRIFFPKISAWLTLISKVSSGRSSWMILFKTAAPTPVTL